MKNSLVQVSSHHEAAGKRLSHEVCAGPPPSRDLGRVDKREWGTLLVFQAKPACTQGEDTVESREKFGIGWSKYYCAYMAVCTTKP